MGDFEIGEVKVYITDDTGKRTELQGMTIEDIKFESEKQNKQMLCLLAPWHATFEGTIRASREMRRLAAGIYMTIPENMKREFTKPTRRGVCKVFRH